MKKEKVIATETFLACITGDEKHNFKIIHPIEEKKFQKMYYPNRKYCEFSTSLAEYNEIGHGIYFQVNTGGRRDNEITKFNCVFIDCDRGKDEHGEYLSMEEVKKYKEAVMDKIRAFPLPPTSIVDTRNGYHVYWRLNPADGDISETSYVTANRKLRIHFQSDNRVGNPVQVMRLPNYFWTKTEDFYMCSVVELTDHAYSIAEILDKLSHIPDQEVKSLSKSVRSSKVPKIVANDDINSRTVLIATNAFQELRQQILITISDILLKENKANMEGRVSAYSEYASSLRVYYQALSEGIIFNTDEEAKKFVEYFPLEIFLGKEIRSNFCCLLPDHDDKKPSAGLISQTDGKTLYNCFACLQTLDIIHLISEMLECNNSSAIQFLFTLLRVSVKSKSLSNENLEELLVIRRNLAHGIYDDALITKQPLETIKAGLFFLITHLIENYRSKFVSNERSPLLAVTEDVFYKNRLVHTREGSIDVFNELIEMRLIDTVPIHDVSELIRTAFLTSEHEQHRNTKYFTSLSFQTSSEFESLIDL